MRSEPLSLGIPLDKRIRSFREHESHTTNISYPLGLDLYPAVSARCIKMLAMASNLLAMVELLSNTKGPLAESLLLSGISLAST